MCYHKFFSLIYWRWTESALRQKTGSSRFLQVLKKGMRKTWSCDSVILCDLAFAAKWVLSPSASKIKQAAGCWSFGRSAKTVFGLLLLVLRKPHSSGWVPTDWIKCMLKHFIINSLPLMSINLISQLKHQWFWWLQMLGGSVTSWSPSPYYFPFLLLPFWVAVTFQPLQCRQGRAIGQSLLWKAQGVL